MFQQWYQKFLDTGQTIVIIITKYTIFLDFSSSWDIVYWAAEKSTIVTIDELLETKSLYSSICWNRFSQ